MTVKSFTQTCFVGVSQIFLQNDVFSGLLITIGMFFGHWALGVSCLLGSALGSGMSILLKYKKEDIQFGLYGFNGSLAFMCAIFTFGLKKGAHTDSYHLSVWILGAVSALIATSIMHLFVKKGKVAYTFPFVITCWVTCYLFSQVHFLGLEQTTPILPNHTRTIDAIENPFFGWAEVDFSNSLINGILVFLGIAIANPSVAMWSTTAATIGDLLAYYIFDVDPNLLANGIYGFSSILVTCAFIGNQFKDFLYVIMGIFLSVFIQYGVSKITIISDRGWATYTIGFIIAGWIILEIKKYVEKIQTPSTNS